MRCGDVMISLAQHLLCPRSGLKLNPISPKLRKTVFSSGPLGPAQHLVLFVAMPNGINSLYTWLHYHSAVHVNSDSPLQSFGSSSKPILPSSTRLSDILPLILYSLLFLFPSIQIYIEIKL